MYKNYFNSVKPPYLFNLIFKFTIRKKLLPLFWLVLLFFTTSMLSQSLGDYRSVNPGGPWTSISSWQYYNGSAWVAATTYPGQNPTGTGNVIIQTGHSITIGNAGLNTGTINSITISGNLTLTGTNTGADGTDYFFNTPLLSVTPLLGTITFINKVDLLFPNNAVLLVTTDTTPNPDYFGLIGDCNHNQDIHIGTSVYAYCNGGGNTALTFFQVMNNGGSLNAIASASAPNCEGNSINLQGNYSGTVGTAVTYNRSIVAPGGGTSTSTLQNPIISNALAGTYTATLTCTTTHNGNNYSNNEMVSIIVSPRPGNITVGTVTQPTCALPLGSITLNNLPAGNWTLNPGAISGNSSSYTVSGLAPGSYSYTVTSANGCVSNPSSSVTLTNPNKVWNGSTGSNWFTASNWTPNGVPSATDCVTIANSGTPPIISGATTALAYSITVLSGGNLTLTSASVLEVTHNVNVAPTGSFTIENSGSLVQINAVSNTGNIIMRRQANIKALDYVYWSSPVTSFSSSAISPLTPTSLIWKWIPTTVTSFASNFGNWANGNEIMTVGKGYIVRSPNGWPAAATSFTATFVGVPNNGTLTIPVSRSTYIGADYTTGPTNTPVTANDDNWNLIGNPYPSAIDAVAFLNANSAHLHNFIDIWTHGNAPAAITSPFYQNFALNYNPNNYLRYNILGGSQSGFDGKIAAGQGFFVLMNDSGTTTENVVFTNNMRSRTYRNDQFYRTSENISTSEMERHRVWLKMIDATNTATDMLIGYATGASNSLDAPFDADNRGSKVNFELYSLCEQKGLSIQGRGLPFDTNDRIPLGIAIAQNGIHTIAISAVDGLFDTTSQSIYLEDNILGITHDLRASPYTFTAAPGRNENRFVLKFNNQTLGIDDFVANTVTVYTNESIHVNTSNQTIQSVRIHDLLGRVLGTFNNVNSNTFSSKNIAKTQSPLLVEVTLENGATKTYKVIF